MNMLNRKYVRCILLVIFMNFGLIPQVTSQVKYNEDLKKSELDTETAMEFLLDRLMADPYLKEHFQWKLFLAQHPMYLLVAEDRGEPAVGERIPPWGAKTKEAYVERVRRNLKSLDDLPELRLNYQWSALELQDLCRNFDDIYRWMQKHYENGSLDFVDGTYSQAHLQVLTSESNWRQFEYGLELYDTLLDAQVKVYARQETGLHMQLPQLLNKFNYRFATQPAFTSTVEITEGPIELFIQEARIETTSGNGFIDFVGLDGSAIPYYLQVSLGWDHITPEREIQQDLISGPKLFNVFPDLDEIDREVFEEYYRMFDWVILEDALDELYIDSVKRAKAKVYANWSYNEGVWAEELFRTMRKAESSVLLTDQMNAMANLNGSDIDKAVEIKELWKTILKSQHHDISWIEVTDLKRKSIDRLKQTISSSVTIMDELSSRMVTENKDALCVFNGLPRQRSALVELEEDVSLKDVVFQNYDRKSYGFAQLPAGGFRSYSIGGRNLKSRERPIPEQINAGDYTIRLSEEGLMEQIITKNGDQLLDGDNPGGEIKARIDQTWYNNRKASTKYFTGEVFDVVERESSINNIPLSETYFFYKNQPFIKVELEFQFDGNEVGYMWLDETKLNVYYPTKGNEVHQDIPFGYLEAKQSRPLFPTNWIACGGLVYIHRGTVKHWVNDGTIANVLAWGDNQFTNRLHWDWIEYSEYDIRLYGNQKIEYYLLPLGEFDGNRITQMVDDIVSPVFVTQGEGERSFYSQNEADTQVTGIYLDDGEVWVRGYQMPDGKRYKNWEIFNIPLDQYKK